MLLGNSALTATEISTRPHDDVLYFACDVAREREQRRGCHSSSLVQTGWLCVATFFICSQSLPTRSKMHRPISHHLLLVSVPERAWDLSVSAQGQSWRHGKMRNVRKQAQVRTCGLSWSVDAREGVYVRKSVQATSVTNKQTLRLLVLTDKSTPEKLGNPLSETVLSLPMGRKCATRADER